MLGDEIYVVHVDDDPEFADLAASFIEREYERITVEPATSARAALDRLTETPVDCIVSDYDMPEMNGIELLEAVRADYPDLPFILYTGKGSEAVASDAITAGVTDYLQKEAGTAQYTVLANRIQNSVENDRTRRTLAERETRLTLFFDQSPLGIIEWDSNFDVTRVNEAAEAILGYPADALIGESWEVIVSDDDRETVADAVSALLADEGGYHTIHETVRGDGERIICEWHNRVVTGPAGDVAAVFSQFQDITDRRRQQRQLETLIDSVPGMVYRCANTPGWPMEQVRGEVESLTGYRPEEIESRTDIYGERIVHPDDQDDVWRRVQDAVANDEAFELTYRIRTKDGEIKTVWERGQLVESIGDDGEMLEGFITDISDREHR